VSAPKVSNRIRLQATHPATKSHKIQPEKQNKAKSGENPGVSTTHQQH